CQRCDTAIPLERLRTLPMIPLCMPCQHDREQTTTPTRQEQEV
nr:TraR/DksA C4-type zinc finger protein [Geodermatophilaceae bacterium]